MSLTLRNNVTVTDSMPFFERLDLNSVFKCSGDLHKHESKSYMKAKHTSIQKSDVFAGPMYIFSESDTLKEISNFTLIC